MHMAKRKQYGRLIVMTGLLGLAFAGLIYRLVDLQVLRHEEFTLWAQTNTEHEITLEPRRGDILDIRGAPLATSVFVKTVCANPVAIGDRQAEVAHAIAPLLELNEAKLAAMLTTRIRIDEKGQPSTNKFVRLKQKVPLETWERIHAAMTNLVLVADEKKLPTAEARFYKALRQRAIFARDDQLRSYPNQNLAAHVLGYTRTEDGDTGNPVSEIVGLDGIEKTFNAKLAGVRGWRRMEIDKSRHELPTGREQNVEPHDGMSVVLTIDSVIQHIMENALAEGMEKHAPKSISGLVIRPRTGEILAMATLPNFDPNRPGSVSDDSRRNRIVTDLEEPGSTFKIVVVSGALNDGTVQLTEQFDCEHGHFFFAGYPLRDHEPEGVLSTEGIITRSSNIGAAKIGIKMGEDRLRRYIQDYGFGVTTGLPLPGEMSGWRYAPPEAKWKKVSIARVPMGQGIAVTRLQMAMAMCALANQGWLMRPMLVDRLEDREHHVVAKYAPQRVRQVVTESTARQMVQALKTVVTPKGTAPKAALEHYVVAGKTGTANKVENGHYVAKFFSSFIGFFPADDPEVCIAITLDEPKQQGYYGGQTAAPVFKQIAEKVANYLNIKPEDTTPAPSTAETALVSPAEVRSVRAAGTHSQ